MLKIVRCGQPRFGRVLEGRGCGLALLMLCLSSVSCQADFDVKQEMVKMYSVSGVVLESLIGFRVYVEKVFVGLARDRSDEFYIESRERYVDVECDLNGDGVGDLFVVDGMGGLSSADFYDGRTRERFDFEHDLILSRAGVDIEGVVVDVHPGDNQKEVMVFTGGGGTIGEYYHLSVFRFDSRIGTLKKIFDEDVSVFENDYEGDHERVLKVVNHISVLDDVSEPFDEIVVSEGYFIGEPEAYSRNIGKLPTGASKRLVFDPAQNMFVPARP